MVLCKAIDAERGRLSFYTHRDSPKGRALAARPEAALCFYFGPQGRQARVGGPVLPAPDADSDDYFASRPEDARIGAWASQQSRPIGSRAELEERVREVARRFGAEVPRPPHWGGYVVIAASVELWISGVARLHDRGLWRREVSDPTGPAPGAPSGSSPELRGAPALRQVQKQIGPAPRGAGPPWEGDIWIVCTGCGCHPGRRVKRFELFSDFPEGARHSVSTTTTRRPSS